MSAPQPTLSVAASRSSRGLVIASSWSDVVYSFRFLAPGAGAPPTIPVNITLLLHTDATVDAADVYANGTSQASYSLAL
jgi:hypothetical protein